MKLGKIFKIFKKGSKAAAKRKGKKAAGEKGGPSGLHIGVYGHDNAGKTVYFTVLNEECKISKKLQISVTDNATAGEFLSNYRSIWGLGTATDVGTVVDMRGEQKFPEPTSGQKSLLFNAILDQGKKVSVVAMDYDGKAVSISQRGEEAEAVCDFMTACDGILFFYDPKIMGAELESQAHVASFVNMLEKLAPLDSRLPIPIAVVINKADILPGFSGDEQVVLVGPEDEYLMSEDFELFLEKVLESNKIAGNSAWAGTVRQVLVKLKDFLRVVLGRTLDFQIFFISATGQTPEKIGTDVRRSIYAPPPRMQPIGVKEPFYWLLNAIIRNKRVSRFRKLAKYAAIFGLIWAIAYSLPNLYHFKWLYKEPPRVENEILSAYDGNIYAASTKERRNIVDAYKDYERSKMVRWIFRDFRGPARRIFEAYGKYNLADAEKNLDNRINEFANVVENTILWPTSNPVDTVPILGDEHKALIAALENYHKGDSTSVLYTRSGRMLTIWNLFTNGAQYPDSTAIWQTIQKKVETDLSLYGDRMSKAEKALCAALSQREVVAVKKVQSQKAAFELDDLITEINSDNSPEYRLKTAVDRLTNIKASLDPSIDRASIQKIDKYLSRAKAWFKNRAYTYKVESLSGDGHLHVTVAGKGQDPVWADSTQILARYGEHKLEWKAGDVIYIAIDTLHNDQHKERWGEVSDGLAVLKGKYSIFDMAREIKFDIGRTATIQFTTGLQDRLPVLKK